MLIDLNARRAARASADKEPKIVRAGEREFRLVDDVKIAVMEAIGENDFAKAAKHLLADPATDWEAFSNEITMTDLAHIVAELGNSMGESSGSTDGSAGTGEPSTPTSAATTPPASPTLATAPTPGR